MHWYYLLEDKQVDGIFQVLANLELLGELRLLLLDFHDKAFVHSESCRFSEFTKKQKSFIVIYQGRNGYL